MSALDDLANAMVQRWLLLPGFVAPDADTKRVDVRRGAPVSGIGATRSLWVEFDGTPDATQNSEFVREPLDLAGTRHREVGQIQCSAIAQTGDDDVAAMEAQALALVEACDADLRSDLTVGGTVWHAMLVSGNAQQLKNERGVAVLVPFTVAYAAGV